jgi:hypothetical protein
MKRLIVPVGVAVAAVAPGVAAGGPGTTSAITGSTAGASGVPACASESGTNYSTGGANTNASSGATGPLPDPARHGCGLRVQSGHRRRAGCLRSDDLRAPGRQRLGRLRRLSHPNDTRTYAAPARPRAGALGCYGLDPRRG